MGSKRKLLLSLVAVVGVAVGYGAVATAWPSPSYVGYFHGQVEGSHSGTSVWPNSGGPTKDSYNGIFGYVRDSFANSEVHTRGCQGDGTLAVPTWVDTPQDFIDFVMCKSIWGNSQEHLGAMFIVGTMMGISDLNYLENGANFFNVWGDTPTSPYPNYSYPNSFPSRVKNAAMQGWINWTYDPGYGSCPASALPNTYYKASMADEFAFTSNCGNSEMRMIVITTPTGTYHLKRYCANPMGTMPPLQTAQTVTATCSPPTLTIAPVAPDPTSSYTVTAVVYTSGGSGGAQSVINGGGKFYMNVSGPGVNSSNSNVTPVTVGSNGSSGTLTASRSMGATNNEGVYTVSYGLTGSVAVSCSGSFTIAYAPYFSVTGGDIAAGPGFGTASCSSAASDISGYNLGSSAGYYGAGSQLGAFASGRITGFATNTTLNSATGQGSSSIGASSIQQPSALAFANTGVSSSIFGTTFNKPTWCVPDYYNVAKGTETTPYNSSTFSLSGLTSGTTYERDGNLTLPGAVLGAVGAPKRITLVVHGDVTITGNITYASYNYVSGTTNVGDIPQFQLLVSGSIYIGQGVTTLTGFYHAQQDGSNAGGIYTCSSGAKYLTDSVGGNPANAQYSATYYTDCSGQLTVYGSLAASKVRLNRTGGNWRTAGSVTNQPAERIVYTPELWLGNLRGSWTGSVQPYDSITSLPPIL